MPSVKILLCGAVIILAGFFPLFFISSHGGGESLEKAVGDYLIDVGYDTPVSQGRDPVRFDFQLFSNVNQTKEEALFTSVWARIMEGDNLLFAGSFLKPTFGLTGMTYAFPKEGIYELAVRFQNGDAVLAQASFPFSVERGEGEVRKSRFSKEVFFGVLVGLFVGAIAAKFIFRG